MLRSGYFPIESALFLAASPAVLSTPRDFLGFFFAVLILLAPVFEGKEEIGFIFVTAGAIDKAFLSTANRRGQPSEHHSFYPVPYLYGS